MRYFSIEQDETSGYSGYVNGTHKWGLPGVFRCPTCLSTWGENSRAYPSVDLTSVTSLANFEEARTEPIEEYERLCAMVLPFLPPGALLEPGVSLGPLVGTATGRFGPLSSPWPWWLLLQREALSQLQAEGIRGLKGCPHQLRFRQRHPPELLELEFVDAGRLHPDCLPSERKPPCPRCGRERRTLPEHPLLNATTLPVHLDLFRLVDFSTVLICTERFVDACHRLDLDGVSFRPLPVR